MQAPYEFQWELIIFIAQKLFLCFLIIILSYFNYKNSKSETTYIILDV